MMKQKLLTSLFLSLVLSLTAQAQATLTVAQDESGDYKTIQEAIDAVAEGTEATIKVKAGTYDGMVKIGKRTQASTKKISLIGEGMDKTIITAANGKNNIGSGKDVRDYATLGIFAPDFYAQDLCVQNTGGAAAGQALAVHVDGDRATFYRCKIAGYQDTHRTKKETRSYYKECVIEGRTDFIYAGGTCWFERCTLNCVGSGYITAPEDITVYTTAEDNSKIWLGFIFNNCTVTKADGVSTNSVALGRCWGAEKCGSMFLNCQLNNVIKAAGWETMGGNDGTKSYYAEYKSKNGDALADVSNRISWSHQLTEADYEKVNTWAKVDAAYRAIKTSAVAFDPEAVIASHEKTTADDYTDIEEGKLLAFPTARGFGKYVSGGRGGKVVEVTNLDDNPSNPSEGSLRWALTQAGKENATIVFKVSGVIKLQPNAQKKRELRAGLKNVTIAGQTAPGEGILIRGGKVNLGGSNNVIIRNLRFRIGDIDEADLAKETDSRFIAGAGLGIENASNIIIDHSCFGWSGEENMTMYDNHYTTVQWCIVHEGLYDAGHQKGSRSYASQWGGSPATYHHNLLAHNYNRSARLNGATSETEDRNVFMEYLNNVNYNWGKKNSCYGGENEAGTYSSHECNFVGNYYKPGPSTPNSSYFMELSKARSGKTLSANPSRWYFADNVMEGNSTATANNWSAVNNNTTYTVEGMKSEEWIYPSPDYTRLAKCKIDDYDKYKTPVETAKQAYEHVLAKAGTINRDATEQRIVDEVRNKQAQFKGTTLNKAGFIDSPADAEGWPTYAAATPYTDNDHDGMDDAWETANGFDPTNADDRNVVASKEGYTALEIFLNSLMGEKIAIIATGIQNLQADNTLTDTAIYTLNGVKVGRMQGAGIYIVKETYADNSVKTRKVLWK
jgi:pectin methylesterase-like acyl-CoA thioesterase